MTGADLIGLVGVAVFLVAYFVVQVLRRPPSGGLAVTLNLIGPVCMLFSLRQDFNLASFVSQWCWMALTLVGWWRSRR